MFHSHPIRHVCRSQWHRRQSRRCRLETLESRRLLSADSVASAVGVIDRSGEIAEWRLDKTYDGEIDLTRRYGLPSDQFVAGNWLQGDTDDMPAAVRPCPGGKFLCWYISYDPVTLEPEGSVTHDRSVLFGLQGDAVISGVWDQGGAYNVGVVRPNFHGSLAWFQLRGAEKNPTPQLFGISVGDPEWDDRPITGDWNNDGITNVGVVRRTESGHMQWLFDTMGDSWPDFAYYDDDPWGTIFGLWGDVPVVGDWNGDGVTNIGVARRVDTAEGPQWQWHLDTGGVPSLADIEPFLFGSADNQPIVVNRRQGDSPTVPLPEADFEVSPTAIDFGSVALGELAVESFRTTNTGFRLLHLSLVDLPDGFHVTPATAVLPPGHSVQFNVSMATDVIGVHGGALSFSTNVTEKPTLSVSLTGRVHFEPDDNGGENGEVIVRHDLLLGEVHEETISPGNQVHAYDFQAGANQQFYIRIVAAGLNDELELEMLDPEKARVGGVAKIDNQGMWRGAGGTHGPLRGILRVVPALAKEGSYRLRIEAEDKLKSVSYQLNVERINPPSGNQQQLLFAETKQAKFEQRT